MMARKPIDDVPNPDNPLVRQPGAINPYQRAVRMVGSRLLWDLDPESWASRRRLRGWRDRHRGEKAVILCNGPSLLKCDFDQLDGVFTFGLNKINLLFEQREFRPDCIVSVNALVLEQNADFYQATDLPLFLGSVARQRRLVSPRPNVAFLHSGPAGFARDCSVSICEGFTVTYVALQLAFHMGFREVALVGADHTFATRGPANQAVESGARDESHFDPNYFAGGQKWQLPDLFESEVAYMRARKTYEAFGRRVVNATVGGELEVFERQSLEDFVDG